MQVRGSGARSTADSDSNKLRDAAQPALSSPHLHANPPRAAVALCPSTPPPLQKIRESTYLVARPHGLLDLRLLLEAHADAVAIHLVRHVTDHGGRERLLCAGTCQQQKAASFEMKRRRRKRRVGEDEARVWGNGWRHGAGELLDGIRRVGWTGLGC